jgi:alkanesulfonate monooxygenase SsuD/methylene tetrahydromethanopterin reductase-like flavin-dependent oxidoreductase (luciferase family)
MTAMELGAHLPLFPLSPGTPSPAGLTEYARAAARLGYRWLTANDHMVFPMPWLDGLTALASVVEASGDMGMATTVSLPTVRGPVPLAKTVAALDLVSGGRFAAGVGAGSDPMDHIAVGAPVADGAARFEESVRAMRALLGRDAEPFTGRHWSTVGVSLAPQPGPGRPPIWVAGGGASGLRRAAELGDGWIASGFATTPEGFAASWATVRAHVAARGGDPDGFANAISNIWVYVTEDRATLDRVLRERLAPMLGRPAEALTELPLPIGPAEVCAEGLRAYADAGVQRMFVWPLGDETEQLERFAERVMPLVDAVPAAVSRAGETPAGSRAGGRSAGSWASSSSSPTGRSRPTSAQASQ